MHGIERNVEEQRFALRLILDDARGLAGEQVRRVALVMIGFAVAIPVMFAIPHVREVVERTEEMAVPRIEPARVRPITLVKTAEMPFADHGGRVASFAQRFGEHPLFQGQTVLRIRTNDADLQSKAHGIPSGHERGARGRAERLDVELFELRAGPRKFVEVRRLDFAAAPTHVVRTEVIGEHEDDIGAIRRDGEHGNRYQTQNEETHSVLSSGVLQNKSRN